MKATRQLHDAGQSLWIDDITRDMLDSGRWPSMIAELSVTGLTSNPTIFEKAIGKGSDYDAAIETLLRRGCRTRRCSSTWRWRTCRAPPICSCPVYKRTAGVDGFVSLEVSPLLAYDTQATIAEAKRLYAKAGKPNLFIKIPGTREGPARHRGGDLCRRARQRDPAVFDRTIWPPPMPTCAAWNSASKRARSGRAFRRVGVHQPLGPRVVERCRTI